MAEVAGHRASERKATAPAADDPRKPDDVADIEKPSWRYILRKTLREFITDQCADLAAGLTFYATLAVFPALLAFVSLLGLFGDAEETTTELLELFEGLVPAATIEALEGPIGSLTSAPSAGFAFAIGLAVALWSASRFVTGFSRAMNRIYNIQEGRPFWKLRPLTLLITVLAIVIAVGAAMLLVVTGPIAETVAGALGVGDLGLSIWNVARWPIIAALAITIISGLYYATPNVRQPRFRWISVGAAVALLTWVVASAGFAFYVSNFASFNETYGSIGGVIVFLLWVWISNLALLFGAVLDSELERGRQLQAGIAAEEQLQLPPRDTRASDNAVGHHETDLAIGRRIRRQSGATPPPPAVVSKTDESHESHVRRANLRLVLTNVSQAIRHSK